MAPVHNDRGASIHSGSEECVGLLLVKTGQLRVYLLSEEGRDVTLYRLFPGDICILSASCVLEAITFDVFIDAEEATDLLVMPIFYDGKRKTPTFCGWGCVLYLYRRDLLAARR